MKRTFDGAVNARVINEVITHNPNIEQTLGTTGDGPEENTVIGLLKNQKGSLVSIYEEDEEINQNTSSINTSVGSSDDTSSTNSVIGILKNNKSHITSISSAMGTPSDLESQDTVIGLLKSIINSLI